MRKMKLTKLISSILVIASMLVLNSTGASAEGVNGWLKVQDGWLYFEDGNVKNGWIEDNGKWYYCDVYFGLRVGWVMLNNEWYYFAENGELLTDTTTPDGYTVDSTGKMV